MKKILKIITIFSLLAILLTLVVSPVFADIDINPDNYRAGMPSASESKRATEMAGKILAIVRTCGVVASMIVLSIIGFKYMLSSLEEKANYKENAIPYIVGCALLILCTTIPSIIYNIMQK